MLPNIVFLIANNPHASVQFLSLNLRWSREHWTILAVESHLIHASIFPFIAPLRSFISRTCFSQSIPVLLPTPSFFRILIYDFLTFIIAQLLLIDGDSGNKPLAKTWKWYARPYTRGSLCTENILTNCWSNQPKLPVVYSYDRDRKRGREISEMVEVKEEE